MRSEVSVENRERGQFGVMGEAYAAPMPGFCAHQAVVGLCLRCDAYVLGVNDKFNNVESSIRELIQSLVHWPRTYGPVDVGKLEEYERQFMIPFDELKGYFTNMAEVRQWAHKSWIKERDGVVEDCRRAVLECRQRALEIQRREPMVLPAVVPTRRG